MTTKTKTMAPTDLAEAYVIALAHRNDARTANNRALLATSRPGEDAYRAAVALSGAENALRDARTALEAAHGPAAVRLAEARAEHRAAAGELTAAHDAGRGPGKLTELAARERAAALQLDQAATEAEAEQSRAQAREALEDSSAPMLGKLSEQLTTAQRALAVAVWDATSALSSVCALATEYNDLARDVRRQLGAAGFDNSARFDGSPRPTCTQPLRVAGTAWPEPEPLSVVAWVMLQAAQTLGINGQLLVSALRPRVGINAHAVDALLAAQVDGKAKR